MENPAPIATVTVVLPPAAESLPASEEAAFVPPDAGAAVSDEPPPHAVQLKTTAMPSDMLPSYRTMKYKSPIWGYFHVQKKQN